MTLAHQPPLPHCWGLEASPWYCGPVSIMELHSMHAYPEQLYGTCRLHSWVRVSTCCVAPWIVMHRICMMISMPEMQGQQQCKSEALIVSVAAGFSRNFVNLRNCSPFHTSNSSGTLAGQVVLMSRRSWTYSQHGTPIAFNGASASEELHLPVAVLPSCSISTTAELER